MSLSNKITPLNASKPHNTSSLGSNSLNTNITNSYTGKVRSMFSLQHYPNLILMDHSDRVSCFDSHITDVKGKGLLLNMLNNWWMNQTKHIIPNHCVCGEDRFLLAKRAKRINLEVIVRGYITGSSKTSLWTLYEDGKENVYGFTLPAGLHKNQKLSSPVITPTSKGDNGEPDLPLTDQQIIEGNYLSERDWEYIKRKSLELYNFGHQLAQTRGLILVDTKYEFGFDPVTGEIMLIDEIHTGDSSRYWDLNTYNDRLNNNQEPICFDKDHIRRYVLSVSPNFKSTPIDDRVIPNIPDNIKNDLFNSYHNLFKQLTNTTSTILDNNSYQYINQELFLDNYIYNVAPLVIILSGSISDIQKVEKVNNLLREKGLFYLNYFHSAHKETYRVMDIIESINQYYGTGRKIVFITVVGLSNALGGVLAANTKFPVINCPNFKDNVDMMVNLNSSIQMPSRVPCSTILRPDNAVIFANNILNM